MALTEFMSAYSGRMREREMCPEDRSTKWRVTPCGEGRASVDQRVSVPGGSLGD